MTLAALAGTSAFAVFFLLISLVGVADLGAAGLSPRRPLRMRSLISGVTAFSMLVRIKTLDFALRTTIFFGTPLGGAEGAAGVAF